MMHRNNISRAIMACITSAFGLSGTASAVNLSQRGEGQVLVYPYYTVNAGNQTLISVVNTRNVGKAVKIRFHEGRNSRDTLLFNLYLSPFDVWTASLFSLSDTGPNNPANLVTTDDSCTVPRLKGNSVLPVLSNGNRYVGFANYAYTGANNDAGPDSLERTREGHFELIEMGEVVDRSNASLTAITHTSAGVPTNCLQIERAWLPAEAGAAIAYWTTDATADLNPPNGGLFGSALIVDALQGTLMAYSAEAIDNFSDTVQHTLPGISLPSLASVRTNATTAIAQVFDNGAVVSSSYPLSQAIDAVSALFVQDAVFNEFVSNPSVGGASEWVLTFPTKYAYADEAIVGSAALAPFTRVFPKLTSVENTGVAEVDIELSVFNRAAGSSTSAQCDIARNAACTNAAKAVGPLSAPARLSFASNVLSFNQPSAIVDGSTILGSDLVINVPLSGSGFFDGWAHASLYSAIAARPDSLIASQRMRADQNGGRWNGLPAVGFWASSYTNGELTPGVLSNYAGSVRLRGSADYQAAQ